MVRRMMLIALVSLGLVGCGAGAGATPSVPPSDGTTPPGAPPSDAGTDDPTTVGRAYVDALARGDTAAAEAMEDATMRAAAPAAALAELWRQLVAQFGAYQGPGAVDAQEQAPYTNVTIHGAFEKATLPLIVTVTADGRVAGFHLGAPSAPGSPGTSQPPDASSSPAAYVRPDAFTETDVTVGTAPWELPGTLSMPGGDGPFLAVVLVAGSGPQDRDETIGPNKPLRDLAWGLASAGIAVLRYDKRTLAHGAAIAGDPSTITVREETIDDAVAAVDLLRRTPGIDPGRVFVAGHSLGGYLAPRIAARAPGRVAGIALLEANSSSLLQLIVEQSEYLAGLQGSPSPQASDQLRVLRAQVARAESPDLAPSTPATELPLGVPAAYWLDLRTYDPLATARALPIPMFFAQGGRDYQVPPSELAAWRGALAGRDDVMFHEYPALDHLLLAGTGPSTPAEYATPGHVAPEVVADLAAWILGT